MTKENYGKHGPKIKALLTDGMSYKKIVQKLGVNISTVHWHAKVMGLTKKHKPRPTYDWFEVQKFIDGGATMSECVNKFGFGYATLKRSVELKKITAPKKRHPFWKTSEQLSVTLMGRKDRGSRWQMKKKLLSEGLPYRCAICSISEWMGEPLDLRLDHVDGDSGNFVTKNLRLLCPNCDSQQDTYCHKHPKASKPNRGRGAR